MGFWGLAIALRLASAATAAVSATAATVATATTAAATATVLPWRPFSKSKSARVEKTVELTNKR